MKPFLHTVFACRTLNRAPDTLENRDVQNMPRAYLKAAQQLFAIWQTNVWREVKHPSNVQSFPELCHHLSLPVLSRHVPIPTPKTAALYDTVWASAFTNVLSWRRISTSPSILYFWVSSVEPLPTILEECVLSHPSSLRSKKYIYYYGALVYNNMGT